MRTHSSLSAAQQATRIAPLASGCLAAAIALVWVSSGQAQNYKSVEPQAAARSEAYTTANNVWDNPGQFQNPQMKQEFDRYFREYLFPAMTQGSAAGLKDLGRHRDQLLRFFQQPAANSEQVYTYLTNMTLRAMQAIASDNYHPIARYNAMLVIGSLDQKPGDPRDANNLPVPLPEAADFMIQQLQANVPDVIKLGALLGLERHAQYGLAEEKRKAVADELVKLLTSPRPGDRTAEFHAWLQYRTAQVLAQMKSLGENNRVHDALVTVMNNDSVPIQERAYVADSLKYLKEQYTPQAGIDAEATVAALGNVLADAVEAEEQEARKFNEQQRGGGMAFNAYTVLGEEPPGYPRGRFLQRINHVFTGFDAVQGALPDELKQKVAAVKKPVEELRTLALDRGGTDVGLTIKIESMADQIAFAAGDLGQAAAPPPADADDLGSLDGLE